MNRSLATLALCFVTVTSSSMQGQPATGRALLIAIDDLHLDFRQTPRARALVKRIIGAVIRPGDVVAVVSTGRSALDVSATANRAELEGPIDQIIGSAPPLEKVLGIGGPLDMKEIRHRGNAALSTVDAALDRLPTADRALIVYVTDGYLISDPELSHLVRALGQKAASARASIFAFSPRSLLASQPSPAGNPQQWLDHVQTTQESLQLLAEATDGVAVLQPEELDAALRRIATR